MIEIWGKDNCPNCTKAKSYLDVRNIGYIYKKLGEDFSRDEVLTEFINARTFPQVKINNKPIGGYEQMISYIETMGKDYKGVNAN